MSEYTLYAGLRLLGFVRDKDGRFEAYGDEFEPLGAFPSKEKADAAVYEAIAAKDREARQ